MTAAGANSRRRRIGKYLLLAASALVLVLAGLGWYVTTDSFQAMVRRRLIAELETITGGKVELGRIHTSPFRLRVDVRDITIRGLEAPSDIPYAHADRVVAQIKIISVLGAEFGFHSIILDHPVIHLIVYPDGTTNQPAPKLKSSGKTPIEQLFRLSISRLEVRRGSVLWNDQKIPVDCVVNDVSAEMQYSLLHRRYISNLLLGKVVTKLQDYRPFAWMLEAHFNLATDGIEINSLEVSSGRSRLQAKGHVKDFRNPQFEGTYDATLDLQEAAAVFRQPEMRRGVVTAQGSGSWAASQFASNGKISVKDLDWQNRLLNLTSAAVDADYSVTPQRLTLSKIEGRLLGGSVTGDADISNWPALASRSKLAKSAKMNSDQKGIVHLRAKDISAGALAAALSTPKRPFKEMKLAGSGSGTLEVRWNRSLSNLEAEVAADVTAPSSPPPSQLPLNSHIHATYRAANDELDVAEFDAATRASEVHASGKLADSGTLKVSASTSDLGEWQPILAAFGRPEHIPAVLHGHAAFNGTAAGRLTNLNLSGNVQAQDFDFLVPATERTPQQSIHWDELNADIQLSQHVVAARSGTLKRGDTIVAFSFSAGLDHGRFTAQSPFTARIDMRQAEAAELLALAGYSYPVQGKINLSLNASGTETQPEGGGHLQLSAARVYGQPVEHLDANVHFHAGELSFTDIAIGYYDSGVTGSAGYNLSTRAFQFDLEGTNFDLARFPQAGPHPPKIQGRMNFTAQGSGTREAPAVNADIRLRDLIVDQEKLGDFSLQATTQGPNLHLTGHSQFRTGELSLEGNVQLRDDWAASADVQFTDLDVNAALRTYLRGQLTGHSIASGDVRVEGPLRRPADIRVDGTLNAFSLAVENVKLSNQGPVGFAISAGSFQLDHLRLVGEDTDLSANGTVQLAGDHSIDLHARGRANLKLVQSFDSEVTSSGIVTMDMTMSGTTSHPTTQGRIEIANGAFAHLELPTAFSDINGSLVFNQNRLQVESLTAHSGGGLVTFGGFVTLYNRQLNFDITLKEQEVRLRYPPGVSSTANADLHLVGSSASSTLSGDVTITKLSVTPGFDFATYLARSARTPVLQPTNPVLNRLRLDVHIVTTPELQMQTAIVRLSGEADLRLRGTAAKPVLLGRADILEGQVYFNGTKYELERGEVLFTNPVTTTPLLDLQASTHVRDYDITLLLNGEPDKLKVTYRSDPPLPEADIITLLAIGRTTTEESAQQQSSQSSFTQEASSAILNQALNATVSNRTQSLFGVSRIKIDPAGLNTETTVGRGPLVTIEQQVSNNFSITYSTSVEQATQQIIQVEYNLSHNVSIVALRDQNGVVSFDVRIRQRKK